MYESDLADKKNTSTQYEELMRMSEMTPTRSYNVRENDRRFDWWNNSSVDPILLDCMH